METLLFLKANPKDSKDLRLEREEKAIQIALESSNGRGKYNIEPRGAITKEDLTRYLNNLDPIFLHISGHGNSDKEVFLEDNDGYKDEIPFNKIIKLIENYDNIRLLFLNTCHSLNGISESTTTISYVIGMKEKVGNNYALEFSREFYKALFSGKTIRSSFNIALEFLDLRKYPKESIPQLLINDDAREAIDMGTNEYPLVSQEEIDKAKKIHISAKKKFSIILSALIFITLISLSYLIFRGQFELSLKAIPSLIPLLVGSYPLSEIFKRSDIINLLELFELQIDRFKSAYSYLTKEDIVMLNKRFATIINI